MLALTLLLVGLAAASPIKRDGQRTWGLFKTVQGEEWYNSFEFVTFDDPTKGKTK